ncbi:kinesin-like protein KIN-6 isoform X2 [Miscanthus floridulus]|uniref:kinesin-like protein KIN-6 isoform X2 n=1 Tax=Miscanthus floridulus TaxID=154761 RepID=UPI00345979C3
MEATSSPHPPTTVRRNPPRRARPPPTPLTGAKPKPSSLSRLLEDEAASAASVPRPPQEDRLKVFLRIRPLTDHRDRSRPVPAAKEPRRKPKQGGPGPGPGPGEVCLAPTGPNSVALTVPRSKLVDAKRGRTEVFDGFSAVFPSNSTQHDIFAQVMNPLVDDFLGGKSGLLVAMGPTGSGKTHTIFGNPRNPGILPLTLRRIFDAQGENKVARKPARSFFLSVFEILSEGKGERILDLLSDAVECVLQQSVIKGLQEAALSNPADAESLVSRGMLKRSTAATNANSNSSRSQCIITIRADSEHPLSSAVLTIAVLAGAERERRTGNRGSRLLESNFINNTSMVFSLCLRSLLEHQKNQKKPLEKHFKNSMLTRYLRDYLEGRKKMTLILNVKPGDDDYLDTSFLLRQASPYMKIKYTSLEDSSDLASQKRINVSLICQENKKKRKVQKPEVLVVEGKENVDTDDISKVSEKDGAQHVSLNSETPRVSRSEAIMTNFARALLTVLRQYKHKLLESENAAESMKELIRDKDIQIRDKDIQIMELKKELEAVKYCSCKSSPITEDDSVNHDDSASSGQAAQSLVSVSNQPDLGSYDASEDNLHVEAQELTCCGPQNSSAPCILKGESDSCDASSVSLIDEQVCSRDFKVELQVFRKELDRSESFTVSIPAHTGGAMPASSYSNQSLTEDDALLCLNTEKTRLSPQCTTSSKTATIGQSEEETEELSKDKDIQHINIREEKHPESRSSSQQVIFDTEGTSSSESSPQCTTSSKTATIGQSEEETEELSKDKDIQHINIREKHPESRSSSQQVIFDTEGTSSSESSLIGTVASEMKLEELNQKSERCEPAIEKATVELEHGIDCGQAPDQKCDHAPVKAAKAPSKCREADETADTNKEAFGSRPGSMKKTRRRLQPAAAMLLREFTGADIDADNKMEERCRSSSRCRVPTGRSDALVQLLMKGRPGGPVRRA